MLGISCSQSPFVTPATAGLKIPCSARGLGGWKEAAHQHELCPPSTKPVVFLEAFFSAFSWGLAQCWKTNESRGFSWGLRTPFWALKVQRCWARKHRKQERQPKGQKNRQDEQRRKTSTQHSFEVTNLEWHGWKGSADRSSFSSLGSLNEQG